MLKRLQKSEHNKIFRYKYPIMKRPVQTGVLLLLFVNLAAPTMAQGDGAKLFDSFCKTCHTIKGGKLIGPDLAHVHQRRDEAWLLLFIQSSQRMITQGDPQAVALFNEYNRMIMPDVPFQSEEIKSILSYIKEKSDAGTAMAASIASPSSPVRSVESATARDIARGRMLFSGADRLGGKGPSCLSCHHVKNDRILGGGLLAKDLTEVYSRMNEAGIHAIVINPPFPAMKEAYTGAAITDEEAFYLTAFLKHANEQQYNQHVRDYQRYMLIVGGTGLALLLLAFTLLWRKRKREIVNQKIFNRQVRSETVTY